MPSLGQLEADTFFQLKFLLILKAPAKIINPVGHLLHFPGTKSPKTHGVGKHGNQQLFGGLGTDDFTLKAIFNQFWKATDMINMGMGQKETILISSGETGQSAIGNKRSPPWDNPQSTIIFNPATCSKWQEPVTKFSPQK